MMESKPRGNVVERGLMLAWDELVRWMSPKIGAMPVTPASAMLLDNLSPLFVPISLACTYAPKIFSGSAVEAFILQLAERHHGWISKHFIVRPDYLLGLDAALDTIPAPSRVLDVCCGTGPNAFRVKERFPEAEVLGTDNSEFALNLAREKAAASGADVRFEVANVYSLPYPDESFDLVVLGNMFPVWEDLIRVLAPGGRLVYAWGLGGLWNAVVWPAMMPKVRKLGGTPMSSGRTYPGFYGVVGKS